MRFAINQGGDFTSCLRYLALNNVRVNDLKQAAFRRCFAGASLTIQKGREVLWQITNLRKCISKRF